MLESPCCLVPSETRSQHVVLQHSNVHDYMRFMRPKESVQPHGAQREKY